MKTRTGFTLGCLLLCHAQAQTITTYAGNDAIFSGGGLQATAVQIPAPAGVASDAQGNIYISSDGLSMVLKVTPGGVITVYAGDGLARYGGDGGPAVGASISNPQGIAFDQAGNLYIADAYNSVVRKVDTSGNITTVAGTGQTGYSGDGGPANKAQLGGPISVIIDHSGNLYIGDNSLVIREVTPDGTISTIAGTYSTSGYTGDGGPATKALISQPIQLALDGGGNLYFTDLYNCAIRKIAGGTISTFAGGTCGFPGAGDGGPATKATMSYPDGVAFDSSGNLYISDTGNERIRQVNSAGVISTVAGSGQTGFSGDGGAALQAVFSAPAALAVDATGAVLVVDTNNSRLRRFPVGGNVSTIAGQNLSIGDSGPATRAILTLPAGINVDSSGNLYIADPDQNRIRKVAPSGIITTVAGSGATGIAGDGGAAIAAELATPSAVAADSAGNLYIADSGAGRIKRVDAATGNISTFAGGGPGNTKYGGNGTGGDGGPATSASLYYPTSVAVDSSGNVYFNDLVSLSSGLTQGSTVRRVTPNGTINTYAGGGYGFGGDGGPAIQALFGNNISIAIGPDNSLYVADQDNNRVRRIDPSTGIITTVAGNGQPGPSGDGGLATAAGVAAWCVTVDPANNLYIGGVNFVRKVTPTGTISTYAGNGAFQFGGDGGPATAGSFEIAESLAVDASGRLFISDGLENRIRVVETASGTLSASPASLNFAAGSASTQTFTVSNNGTGTLAWGATLANPSDSTWLAVTPASGSTASGQSDPVTVTVTPGSLAAGDYYGEILIASSSLTTPIGAVTVRLTIGAAGPTPPNVASGGVLSTASYSLNTAVSPGMLVAIFGTNLTAAGQVYTAGTFPWPETLGGASVTIGGEPLPLYAVTPDQINAILPYDLPAGATLPLVVTYGNAISPPVPVNIVADQPGVYTLTQNGTGTGIVVIVHPDGSQVLAGGSNAAQAGDALVIYGTGMGAVSPRAVAGAPTPILPLSKSNDPVTVTIGGVNAPVFFAGLTSGFSGLYQVNVTVPQGIKPSATAPLVLTQGGNSSPTTVTIPVQ
jgi:uncharacterized protein (TIGR03437 family)